MGRVHEALHRLFTRDFCPLPSLDPRPLPNMENVFTRYTRENMDRSLTSEQEWPPLWRTNRCLCSPLPRAIPPFYLIHYWQLTAEQKSRSKLEIDRARWAIFLPRVAFSFEISIDLDSLLSRNIILLFSDSKKFTRGRGWKEGCIEAGFSERYIVNERDYAIRGA